jgi:hypothetical protein
MYKIIGANQVEYGPVTADQLRQWITEGRVNAQTMVQAEGDTGWKPLSAFPEFASSMPPTPPPGVPPAYAPAGITPLAPSTVPNYLVQAILCTLCCCLPFGIVAIVYAAQVNGKLQAGDFTGAQAASKNAKMWCWIAFGLGLVSNVIILFIEFAAGLAQGLQQH